MRFHVSALLVALTVSAQTPTGQFTGQVRDPVGASVPETRIVITNVNTGFRRETVTNASGNYTAPLLTPGEYRLTAQKEGFRPVSKSGATLQVDQVVRIDFTLEIGAVSERVEVNAEAPLVDQSTASLGTVVENSKIVDLPLNTRNAFRLALIAPGVTPAPGFGDQFNTATGFRVNGGRANQNEIMVDGVSNSLSAANPIMVVGLFPSPDALQEFKIQTSTYSAEYGRTSGGVINMVIKSGTNEFHGSIYEFLRNSAMDANSFFANRAGRDLPSLKRNQFGVTLGGPVKKNKAFFFVNYEGLRLRAGSTATRTVPTELERNGDFSRSFSRVAGQCTAVTIHDPVTTRSNPNGTGFIRDAFPNNRIPANRLDPVGVVISRFYPLPNTAGDACTGANNFFSNKSTRIDTNQTDAKLDWAPSDSDRFFFGVAWRKREDLAPNHYGNAAEPMAGINGDSYPAGSLRLDYTRVQSPSLILNFRAGATRLERHFSMSDGSFSLSSL
ncbi:MAG: TonB-dependent receptor, partial [Bryobacteraceae bacterium]